MPMSLASARREAASTSRSGTDDGTSLISRPSIEVGRRPPGPVGGPTGVAASALGLGRRQPAPGGDNQSCRRMAEPPLLQDRPANREVHRSGLGLSSTLAGEDGSGVIVGFWPEQWCSRSTLLRSVGPTYCLAVRSNAKRHYQRFQAGPSTTVSGSRDLQFHWRTDVAPLVDSKRGDPIAGAVLQAADRCCTARP